MKLRDIAAGIEAHLKRIESSKELNPVKPISGTRHFYCTCAWSAGAYVGIRYVSYQGDTFLRREAAAKYLAWLDAGNVGTHWSAARGEK